MKLEITQQGKERMLQMADFLDTLKDEQFNFSILRGTNMDCGTVGCIVGWTPEVFPELVYYKQANKEVLFKGLEDEYDYNFVDTAAQLFGIDKQLAANLFLPGAQYKLGLANLSLYAIPQEAAQMLRDFLKLATVAN